MIKRLVCLIAAALLLVLSCSAAFATSSDYDSAHPEKLNDMDIVASAAILIELNSGMVVYEKNADTRMYPASTTKIVTTYLGLLLGDMEQTVVTTPTALQIEADSSTIPLAAGEEINFKDLLYATMVRSGNEGANLIAETIGGNQQTFVDMMNAYVSSLGCKDTHFMNPSGLHNDYHYTTARDMATIAREAMQDETFRDIASTYKFELPKSNIYRARTLTSRMSELLDPESTTYYAFATGVKTGYTSKAGNCFVGTATKDGVTFLSVIFNSNSYRTCWEDTKRLMEYGFTQYVHTTVSELYAMRPKILEISRYDLSDPGLGQLELTLNKLDTSADDSIVTLKSKLDYLSANFNDLVAIEYVRDLVAPISAGELIGRLTFYPEAGEPIEYELVASRSIARRVLDFPSLDEIIEASLSDANPFPRFTVEIGFMLALLAAIVYLLIVGLRRLLGIRGKKKPRKKPIKPISRYYR